MVAEVPSRAIQVAAIQGGGRQNGGNIYRFQNELDVTVYRLSAALPPDVRMLTPHV